MKKVAEGVARLVGEDEERRGSEGVSEERQNS